MAKLFQLIALLFLVTFINGLPVDETPSGQFVIDIPAGKATESHEAKVEEPTQLKVEDSAEVIPVNSPSSSEEDGGHRISSISDLFNIRVPFSPLFVYRRPVIRDPFESSFSNYRPSFSPVERDPNGYDVMSHMEAMMKRMQQQMTSLWSLFTPQYQPQRPQVHRRPFFPFGYDFDRDNETETDEGVDTIHIDNLPSNYSNSTSETKVIDGQLVEVNKTIHKISNNDSSSFFQVQVIKIRPQANRKPVVLGTEETQGAGEIHQQASDTQKPEQEKETSNIAPSVAAAPGSGSSSTAMNKEDPKMNEIDSPAAQRPESVSSGIDQGLLDKRT